MCEKDNEPENLPAQIDELHLIIKYLCEHSKIMDRNYIKSRADLDEETVELVRSEAFLLQEIENLKSQVLTQKFCTVCLMEFPSRDCPARGAHIP